MINNMPSDESIRHFSEDDIQKYNPKQRSIFICWRKKRLGELERIAYNRYFSSTEEEQIMQDIERKAGCKIHRIPSVPARIIIEHYSSCDHFDPMSDEEYAKTLEKYRKRDYITTNQPYLDLLKYSYCQPDLYNRYSKILLEAAYINDYYDKEVKKRIESFKWPFIEDQGVFSEDCNGLDGYYHWPYFFG